MPVYICRTMRKTAITIVALLAIALSAQAQKHVNEFQLSFTPKYYINKVNVENDDFTDSYISTENNLNAEIGVSYHHRFPSGITITQNVAYGTQSHKVDLTYHLDNFDPKATENLKGESFRRQYNFDATYVSNKVLVGYSHFTKKGVLEGWRIEGRVGAGMKMFKRSEMKNNYIKQGYWYDDASGGALKSIADIYYDIDDKSKVSAKLSDNVGRTTGVAYLGMTKDVKGLFILKSINIGVEVNWLLYDFSGGFNEVEFTSLTNSGTQQFERHTDYYRSQNLNIGLRIAVGLWK